MYAQLPDPGDAVEAGEECGALESVKAASDIYCPVTGTVAEKNEAVEDGPALINQSPTGEGWLFRWVLITIPAWQRRGYSFTACNTLPSV